MMCSPPPTVIVGGALALLGLGCGCYGPLLIALEVNLLILGLVLLPKRKWDGMDAG